MTLKAGIILINKNNIGLIYRASHDDYSFPKGHLEDGESLLECAIRETNEETKREVKILSDKEIYIETYTTPRGEECECHYFIGMDNGKSNNTSEDTHDLIWTNFDKVGEVLSYDSLKKVWASIKDEVKKYIEE